MAPLVESTLQSIVARKWKCLHICTRILEKRVVEAERFYMGGLVGVPETSKSSWWW
jgi:hypothetical protein